MEETRAITMEEHIKKVELQLLQHIAEANQKAMTTNEKNNELGKKLDLLMEKMFSERDEILGAPPGGGLQNNGVVNHPRNMDLKATPAGRNQLHNFSHKVEFPYFEDGDPQTWIRKCDKYLHDNQVKDPEEKLEMVVLHLKRSTSLFT
ncbi:hypothetical protein FXO37_15948 [Capsicum annuum]|nr:hypothetical protein FXO37_15948 [Capsicum annuum]